MAGGSHGTRRITESIERGDTQFGTRIADSTSNRIEAPSTYSYNTDRHKLVVNGTFIQDDSTTTKFVDHPGKYELAPAPGDTVEFQIRERLRYVPNYEILWGAAAWYASDPDPGQRLFVEVSDDARENAYRYAFEPDDTRIEQVSGGTVVDRYDLADWGDYPNADAWDHNPLAQEGVDRTSPLNPRSYLAWYGVLAGRYNLGYVHPPRTPRAPTIGYTANPGDIATEEINLNIKTIAECDAGASGFSAYAGSAGGLVRGNATQFDRAKTAPFWNLGGTISGYLADNDPLVAARIDPARPEVTTQLRRPEVAPDGTDTIEVLVAAVPPSQTDANFQDPDDDGTNEGTAPRAQVKAQNDVLQWTRSVTTFPTESGIRRDGTEGQVPNVRYLADSIGTGGGNNDPANTGTSGTKKDKILYEDEVALFIPAADPATNITDGSIKYLVPYSSQNW